jgi:hypothetical protein
MSVGVDASAGGPDRPALPIGVRVSMYVVCAYVLVQSVSVIRAVILMPTHTIFVVLEAVFLILDVVMVVLVFRRARAAQLYGITICILNLLSAAALFWGAIRLREFPAVLDVAYFAAFLLALVFLARWRNRGSPARSAAPVS